MSRSIVIILRTISFCVLANVVCGSQYYYWSNGRTRNPRYASCPSCHRDCPDALSSPWYSRQSYTEISPNRNYQNFDGRSYREQATSGSLSTFYPRNEYERSPRSGGANPTDVTASGTANPHRYRESFEDQQLRRIDPYLASKPSTPPLRQPSVPNPYPFMSMTNSLINNNYERQSYQSGKFTDESTDRSANFPNIREFNGDRSTTGLNAKPYRSMPTGSSSMPKDVMQDYSKASPEKFLVVYRADRHAEQLDGNEEDTLPFVGSDSMDEFKESEITSKDTDGPFTGIHLNSFFLDRRPPARRDDELVPSSREPFPTSNLIREPEIKRNPYNLSPRSNAKKMMQDVRDINQDENPLSFWQDDNKESSDEETDKSWESLTRDTDYYVSPINEELPNESTKLIDVPNNEEEKLHSQQEITETKGHAIGEASLKFNPDFIEDIENPPVEPTEPTPTNEPTETSTTEKHSR